MAAASSSDEKHFVDQYWEELIQNITMVHPILDHLLQKDLLTQEQCDIVKAENTTQSQMRILRRYTRGWGNASKDTFCMALRKKNPGVLENLEDKLKKTAHNNRSADFRKEYKESVKEKFQRMKEYNSRMGEAVSLQKRYTKLLMRKGRQNKEDKEQEIRRSGGRHLQITEKRSSEESSPTTVQELFECDKDGFLPKIVVLQGPAGIGKTMTSKKILLDWASGDLYQDMFDFVFYLSCREINTITGNTNLVGLLSGTCRLPCSDDLVSILKDPKSQKRLLIVVDGFDELRWTLTKDAEGCHDPEVWADVSEKTHKEIILQRLLKKQVLHKSYLIITTRSLALDKLNTFIKDYRCVEVLGFTREDCEEYVHKFFGNREDADKVLSIIKDNAIVYTMCSVPVTCWIVCTVMEPEVRKDLAFIRCHTMTSIYLRYLKVLLTHHIKKDQPGHRTPEAVHTCLKKLCALANEGVLHQQILFGEGDLKRHGLSLSEVESVFLNKNIFHWDIDAQTCYSFIHLSVQEFLAALYYALDYGVLKGFFLPNICKGRSLSDLCSDNSHLALAVQFLFGLLNEKLVKTFLDNTGINISLRARSAMEKWAMKSLNKNIRTHTIFCLYETQDEDFIRSIMSSCSSLMLQSSHTGHLWMNNNYSKQMSYCLTALKTKSFQSLHFYSLTVDSECQKKLSPLLHRCENVRFELCTFHKQSDEDDLRENKVEDNAESSSEDTMYPVYPDDLSFLINPESKIRELQLKRCRLTSSCWDHLRSVLITNPSLTKLDLSKYNLQDSGIKRLCEGLRDPRCVLQELRLERCDLTSSCCDHLRSVLITNRSLTKLDLSHNNLQDSGIKRLCEGLRDPRCVLQELVLNHCGLTSSCWDHLHSVLITNRSLTKLDISMNNLQDSGIKRLCEGLRDPRCVLPGLVIFDCKASLLCADDLCSVITTNRTLTSMGATLDADEEMSASELNRYRDVLRRAGFFVYDWRGPWVLFFPRRRVNVVCQRLVLGRSYSAPDMKRTSRMGSDQMDLFMKLILHLFLSFRLRAEGFH